MLIIFYHLLYRKTEAQISYRAATLLSVIASLKEDGFSLSQRLEM